MVTQQVIATITPPFPLCAELTWLLTPEMKVVPFPTTESHLSSPRQECAPLSQCYWGHKACSKPTEERGKPLLSTASKSFIHISNVASPILRLQLDAELTQGRQSRWKHSIPSYSPLFCFLLWCPLPFDIVSHRQRDGAISLSLLLISNRFTKLNRRKGKRSTWIHWYKHTTPTSLPQYRWENRDTEPHKEILLLKSCRIIEPQNPPRFTQQDGKFPISALQLQPQLQQTGKDSCKSRK